MKVATFNINNINKRLDNLLAWLAKAQPDVVSLQELKAEQDAFPVKALRTLGYEAVWQGERPWNGVAILARNHTPVVTRTSLPGNSEGRFSENRNPKDRNPEDHQARYIEAAVQGVLITSIYLPNGDYIPKDFADWREIPSQALERRELRDALIKALESLPEKYREILILRDVNHLSITETAQILGLSEANVKTRLSRARLQMRDALASGFGGLWTGRSSEKVQTS